MENTKELEELKLEQLISLFKKNKEKLHQNLNEIQDLKRGGEKQVEKKER